jgi:hypothetical protein
VLLAPGCEPLVFQCNATAARGVVAWLASGHGDLSGGIEAFIPSRGAGARRDGAAVTRRLVTELTGSALKIRWHERAAGLVKPWATDKRLLAAGLYQLCQGMPHARDAARHAIYCAAQDCGMPDPLSRDGASFWRVS